MRRRQTRPLPRALAVGAAVLAALGLLAGPAGAATVGAGPRALSVVEEDAARFEDRILQLLNADRTERGLRPVQRSTELDAVARAWSAQMARVDTMSHNPHYTRMMPAGWQRAGENVAMGYLTPENMYRGWFNSPGHQRTMFHPDHTHVGIGIAYARGGGILIPYGTQNFGDYSGRTLTQTRALPADTAQIDDGGTGGSGAEYHLGYGGTAEHIFRYGNAGCRTYVGDWDGDGTDTLVSRVGNTFHVRDSNSSGNATRVVTYGRPGDRVYVGDWDGDGRDTFAVRRGNVYHVKNSLTGGPADHVIAYGRAADDVLVGDWDGDGRDTFAVRRGSVYHVKNSLSGGPADQVVAYGRAADDVYVGDWDGDGADTFTVRRGRTYFVADAIRGGSADRTLTYGRERDTTLVGDWSGRGRDGLGIRR